jgi:predicted PurR-regulated permease PerM
MDQFLLAILSGIFIVYWLYMLVDCIRLKSIDRRLKITWVVLIIMFGPPLGALIYHSAKSSLMKASVVNNDGGSKHRN